MFTIIIYHKQSKKVIAAFPLEFSDRTRIRMPFSIMHDNFDFGVYNSTEPILYEDGDGDICLKENSFIINSNDLLGENY